MSLTKRVVSVPLIGGLTDEDDAFAGDPPGFETLDNARWNHDKQIGKRFGITALAEQGSGPVADSAPAPNAVVDLDGVGHVITASGTYRRNPKSGEFEPLNWSAVRPARVVTDPLVRVNGTCVKSDAAVAGTTVCAVWEQVDGAGAAGAFYAFYDISGDVPRPIAGPTAFATVVNSCRVVAIGSNIFLATGLDAAANGHIYTTIIDISTTTTWTFAAETLVDQVSNNHYGLGEDTAGTHAFLCYLDFAGPVRIIKKISAAGAITATKNLSAFGVQHVMHNSPLAQVFVIGPNGDISYCADDLSGVATAVNPFTNPASGLYTGRFFRASIGRADATGNMWAARSTSGPHSFVGTAPLATQFIRINGATKAASAERLIGGVVLTAHFSQYISAIDTCLVGVGQQGAFYTADSDPTVAAYNQAEAYKVAPVGYLVQPAFPTGITSTTILHVWGRYGQDAMELFGNQAIGTAALGTATSHLPHLDTLTTTTDPVIVSAYPIRFGGDFLAGLPGNFKREIDLLRASVQGVNPVRNVSAQALRIMGGGAGTYVIDGISSNELTPPVPEWIQFDSFDAGTAGNAPTAHIDTTGTPWGGLPNPNRQWGFIVHWQYTDARGNVHRGPPSSICWSTVAKLVGGGGPGGQAGKLCLAPWGTSQLAGDKLSTELCVYAAPYDAPTDFRLMGTVEPVNDTADEGRVYVAIMTGGTPALAYAVDLSTWDSVRPIPRTLFTTALGGGELSPWTSPPLLDICSTQSRLWGLNGEDRLDVWFSKPVALGFAPEWSDTNRVRIPQDGGPAVGIAAIDDKVVVFKRTKVFVIEGDPGDATGGASSLRQPRLVSGDVGCDSVDSIVEGPFGVIFHGSRGFMTLDRSLQYAFIGDRVQDQFLTADKTQALTVISAALVPSESEVRYILDTRRLGGHAVGVAWNYRFNRWTHRDALPPTFNAVVDGVEWFVIDGDANTLYRESPGSWAEFGTNNYRLSMTSTWIKLNGIAGFGRLWRAVFLFRYFANGINITSAQDYKAITESVRTWDAAACVALADATTGRLELVVQPKQQQCEAVQFVISELIPEGTTSGRGFELVGVTFEVGVKPGAFKRLAAAARK